MDHYGGTLVNKRLLLVAIMGGMICEGINMERSCGRCKTCYIFQCFVLHMNGSLLGSEEKLN